MKRAVLLALLLVGCDHENPTVFDARPDSGPPRDGLPPVPDGPTPDAAPVPDGPLVPDAPIDS